MTGGVGGWDLGDGRVCVWPMKSEETSFFPCFPVSNKEFAPLSGSAPRMLRSTGKGALEKVHQSCIESTALRSPSGSGGDS